MQQKIYRLFKKLRIKEESELGENKATIAMKKEKSLDLNACFKFIENTFYFFFQKVATVVTVAVQSKKQIPVSRKWL